MAITKDSARQYPLVAKVDVTYSDLTGLQATATAAIDVPANAVVTGGWVDVTTVFNSTTSDVLIVGDGDDPNRYVATCNLQALGVYHFMIGDVLTVNTAVGHEYTLADTIDVTHTAGTADTATTGAFTLYVQYYIDGRANEVQG